MKMTGKFCLVNYFSTFTLTVFATLPARTAHPGESFYFWDIAAFKIPENLP
jgi:hypothetical protein